MKLPAYPLLDADSEAIVSWIMFEYLVTLLAFLELVRGIEFPSLLCIESVF